MQRHSQQCHQSTEKAKALVAVSTLCEWSLLKAKSRPTGFVHLELYQCHYMYQVPGCAGAVG